MKISCYNWPTRGSFSRKGRAAPYAIVYFLISIQPIWGICSLFDIQPIICAVPICWLWASVEQQPMDYTPFQQWNALPDELRNSTFPDFKHCLISFTNFGLALCVSFRDRNFFLEDISYIEGVNGVNRLATKGEKYYWLPTKRVKNYRLPTRKILTDYRHGLILSRFVSRKKSILHFFFLGRK